MCGCEKTPEKEVVLSKVDGLPEGTAVEKSKEVKEISVPENWEETISKNDGAVTVEAKGISIFVPEIKNTPITEVKRTAFGEEQLKKLTDYFRGNNPLQESSLLTKDEGSAYMEKIKNKEGAYGNPSLEEGMNATDRLSNLKKIMEALPGEDIQTAEIKEPAFDSCFWGMLCHMRVLSSDDFLYFCCVFLRRVFWRVYGVSGTAYASFPATVGWTCRIERGFLGSDRRNFCRSDEKPLYGIYGAVYPVLYSF